VGFCAAARNLTAGKFLKKEKSSVRAMRTANLIVTEEKRARKSAFTYKKETQEP